MPLRRSARPLAIAAILPLFTLPILTVSARARAQAPAAPNPTAPPAAGPPPAAPSEPPAPPTPTTTEGAPLIPEEAAPDKKADVRALEAQGSAPSTAPAAADSRGASTQVFSDDWWSHTRPLIEFHGFFRTRGELFHNFSLGRIDSDVGNANLFPRPADDTYLDLAGNRRGPVNYCGPNDNPGGAACESKTNAMANMRFRIDPEIHISDNLRILSQIDALDNLVLGSTPEGYVNEPGPNGQYQNFGRGGYTPLGAFSQSQVPPTSGVNSYQDSIQLKRVWAEYNTPVGQIRFGRMPNHWGLGVLVNNGDRLDDDYQSHVDRLLFITGIKSLDLYFGGAWDFPNTGRTSRTVINQQGQPYDVAQLDDVNQWVLTVFKRTRPEIQRQRLARGEVVVNGGMWAVYRQQILANESVGASLSQGLGEYGAGLTRVGARAFIPDFWLQVLTKNLRWETELVYIYGSIENPVAYDKGVYEALDYKIRQFGAATELEYRALNDDLRLSFWSGFASGDQGIEGLAPPAAGGLQPRANSRDRTVSTFRFNPSYRVDLILFRNILTRVQGVYYFRPGVEYDFTKSLDGEKFGGRADIIYSRASKSIQTPGNKEDLGIELDLTLYYQSKDGTLNNDPSKLGGFYGMLQYGVLFPLGGLGYPAPTTGGPAPEISSAQVIRLFLGVAY
jgi:uncharacterized protein (TIGR04551 family)